MVTIQCVFFSPIVTVSNRGHYLSSGFPNIPRTLTTVILGLVSEELLGRKE
jgi:hypothetical protein